MNFSFSSKVKDLQRRLQVFMDEHIYPNEQRYHYEIEAGRRRPYLRNSSPKPAPRACGICSCRIGNMGRD